MVKKMKSFNLLPKNYIFNDDQLPTKLPKLNITGKDTSHKRFILVYKNENEKMFFMKLLSIDGKKVIYSLKDFSI